MAASRKPVFFERPVFLSCFAGLLLALAFPGFKMGFLAWGAFVPLFAALRKADSAGKAAACGAAFGGVFFAVSLYWITYVTGPGLIFLVMLETSFVAGFAAAYYFLRKKLPALISIFGAACAWTAWEWLRAEIPAFGFGWNMLAYSQSDYYPVRLAANTVGAYGLGCAIVLVNVCIFELWKPSEKKNRIPAVILLVLTVVSLFAHGIYHSNRKGEDRGIVRISVLQGNIPQSVKWEAMARDEIVQIYEKLAQISAYDGPDLMIWPEAAWPGYFNRDAEAPRIQAMIKEMGVPSLIGAPHLESSEIAYNSAYLVDADGGIAQRYDKQHLVPFGEYVPLGPVLGWLKPLAYTLGVSDFTEGRDWTVFKFMNGDASFSTLICYEDIFPPIAKGFADRGAQFLAVITNDAWFGPTSAPYQHEQASIFRAIENGLPVVRSANTGVSSFISAQGRVLARAASKEGKEIFVTAKKTYDLPLVSYSTLYRKGGWIFPYAAIAMLAILLVLPERKKL